MGKTKRKQASGGRRVGTETAHAARQRGANGKVKPTHTMPRQNKAGRTQAFLKPKGQVPDLANGSARPHLKTGRSVPSRRGARSRVKAKPELPRKNKRAGGGRLAVTDEVYAASHLQNGATTEVLKPKLAASRRKTKRGNGEADADSASPSYNGSAGDGKSGTDTSRARVCQQIRDLQRQAVAAQKAVIAIENQLAANVAVSLGYFSRMEEKDRQKRWKLARETIAAIRKGQTESYPPATVIFVGRVTACLEPFREHLEAIEARTVEFVDQLPIAAWCDGKEQRGFGRLSLARIVGEAGDLSAYANPGKLWKRMGCAPYNGHMPSSWRSGRHGKLSTEEWESLGYCPRRRSVMFPIGEALMKLNQDGPYRARYDVKKAEFRKRFPDTSDGHCHNHGLLLVAKELLKRMWLAWRRGQRERETDDRTAPTQPATKNKRKR